MKGEPMTLSNDAIYKFLLEQNKKDKPKHLHVSTPKFTGNVKEDVEDWLFMVKQGFISSKILDEDRLNAIVNFVSDLPMLILKKHIQFTSSWYEFEKELKETFKSVDKDHKIRGELSNLKHRDNMSIEQRLNMVFQRKSV